MKLQHEINEEKVNNIFKIMKRQEELDETKFDNWKYELQKELPTFWQKF